MLGAFLELRTNLKLTNWSVSVKEWIPLFSAIKKSVCFNFKFTNKSALIKNLNSNSVLEGLLIPDFDLILLVKDSLVVSALFSCLSHALIDHLDLRIIDCLDVNFIETRIHGID